jgi:hypothetical protein
MRISNILLVLFSLSLSLSVNAATVFVNSGDSFVYDEANDYTFLGSLSAATPFVSYGANVPAGKTMNFLLFAPAGIDLIALLSTGPYGTGTGILDPYGNSIVPGGTSFLFPISGDDFISAPVKWLTFGLGTAAAIARVDTDFGGQLPVSLLGGYVPPVGTGGGGVSAVPIPAAAFMFAPALLGFMGLRKKMSKVKV